MKHLKSFVAGAVAMAVFGALYVIAFFSFRHDNATTVRKA